MTFGARFDDLVDRGSYSFEGPVRQIVATRLDEVVDAVTLASREAANGRWVAGYVAYDAAPAFDSALTVPTPVGGVLAWFGVFDGRRMDPSPVVDPMASGGFSVSNWTPTWDRRQYDNAFDVVRQRIEIGDAYQVNLTFPMRAAFSGDPRRLYAELVAAQHSAYGAHMWHGDRHVISVSPERFFSIRDGRITTRPMKGTVRRGRWLEEDDAVRQAFAGSDKDRAENLMIVDLLRNDLGRIAEFGSVTVDELFRTEKYPTVWQMTSEVSAILRSGTVLSDVFRALFPCGSVTGAPKTRAMEIISELEPSPRGVYCGAIGFIPPGDGIDGASFSVAIRTATIDQTEGIATYGVGGALTWDSTADGEFDEAMAKARVLSTRPATVELVETIRWDGEFIMLDEHIERLSESADYWDMPCDTDSLRPMLSQLEGAMEGPTMVRVLASGDGNVTISLRRAPDRFATSPGPEADPVVLKIDLNPLDQTDPRLFHKLSDREHFDDRRKRHPTFEDVLCVNQAGNVTESTIANVAFLIAGQWTTPPASDGLLNGILRHRLVSDGFLVERSVSISESLAADAVALISSVRGWRPAVIHSRARDPRN